MTQPDCLASVGVAPEPEPTVTHELRPAAIAVVVILVAIALVDLWALYTKHRTISQMFQGLPLWQRITLAVVWAIAGIHLFFGGPIK